LRVHLWGRPMSTDERYIIFFEYRYLIDSVLEKFSHNKYDIEELYDVGIAGMFHAIDSHEKQGSIDIMIFALFHIKRKLIRVSMIKTNLR